MKSINNVFEDSQDLKRETLVQGKYICRNYAKFYKDILKTNTFMAIKISIPTCLFQHGRHLLFGIIKISFSTLAHISLLLYIL